MAREWIEVTTFGDLAVRAAAKWPDNDAIVFPDSRHTYASFEEAAFRAARSLLGLGVEPGDRVGILMPNCMDFVEVMFGASLIGAWVIPVNARFKGRELSYVVDNGDVNVLVTSDIIDQHTNYVEILHDCLPGLVDADDPENLELAATPDLKSVVLLGSSSPAGMVDRARFQALADGHGDDEVDELRARIAVRDIAMMLYTSGTTADPKGCPITHEAVVRTAVAAGRTRFEMTGSDVFWDPLPLFHMSAILPIIGCFDAGAAFVTLTHFDPATAIAQMRDEGATICFSTFPPVTMAMLNHPDWDPAEFERIRIMNNVAPPDALKEVHAALPTSKHMNAYGCTEVGGVACFTEPDDPDDTRAHFCGRPYTGVRVQIRDMETQEVLGSHQRGEIWVKGYNLFEGYYRDDEKNAECFDDDGWFNTGDLGIVDDDGRVGYQGRIKDMLKVGGENVAAVEIESYLQTHPAVAIAQVIALPDPKYVEVPAAFVELTPGKELTEQELIDYCTGEIARFKIPRHVRFLNPDEWPLSATKVQKFRLQDKLRAELGI